MATPTSPSSADIWQLDGTKALLRTPQLTAAIDLLCPGAGLQRLVYDGDPNFGFVLGVSSRVSESASSLKLLDAFVRGYDLVATYAEAKPLPFSFQVYWRVSLREPGILLLDTILSLQTDLLDSTPSLAVQSKLLADSTWLLSNTDSAAAEIVVEDGQEYKFPRSHSDGLLLRSPHHDWSYAEMTHSEDRGESEILRLDEPTYQLHHRLGGQFLEKGVIRRLRVRGVFLPRENDLEIATQCLASLETENPPLTV